MSSFHPHIALLLNITQNHGERYSTLKSYAEAKMHIVDRMREDDYFLYFADCEQFVSSYPIKCQQVMFSADSMPQELFPDVDMSGYQLIGQHNQLNLYAALFVCQKLGIDEDLSRAISTFRGVEFRLQRVDSKFGFAVFNDAKSTNWDATLTAMRSFKPDEDLAVIIGGQFRGHGDAITPYLEYFRGRQLLLIGQSTDRLAQELQDSGVSFVKLYSLSAVKEYLLSSNFQGTLLFSPAFPSFDQFKNYVERGRVFTQLFSE
jgi:UDP-N-acetylmuramoylalanine--D-glutamate ligase